MAQYPLDLIGLLDLDAETDGVDGRFDENALVFIAGDDERVKKHFLRSTAMCGQ